MLRDDPDYAGVLLDDATPDHIIAGWACRLRKMYSLLKSEQGA